jgi:CSLREA domain-containing protein
VFIGILLAVLISAFAPTADAADFTVNSNVDDDDGSCDPQNCTLREAINAVNAGLGKSIDFNPADFPTESLLAIVLVDELPAIMRSGTTINGSGAGVVIDGTLLGAGKDGLVFESGVGSTLSKVKIRSIGVRNFPGNGIVVCGGARPNCSDPVSRITVSRVTATGNGESGILIAGSANNQSTVNNSYAEGNNSGILITAKLKLKKAQVSNCTVIDNLISGILLSSEDTNRKAKLTDNTAGHNGGEGMVVYAVNRTINPQVTGNMSFDNLLNGIIVTAADNVTEPIISKNYAVGNGENGIRITSVSSSEMVVKVKLQGNRAVNNVFNGILLEGSKNHVKDNMVSGNLRGITLYGTGQNNKIQDNRVRGNDNAGILVGMGSTDAQIKGNEARGNGTDLVDENGDCDANAWRNNRFVTANRACIK